ncbi:MAG: NAD(P)/FAD-dependent oxidoreductase [Phycicoccus sp.]
MSTTTSAEAATARSATARSVGVDEEWDVVVVGAGPAGSAAALGALAADPTLRVLVLDRADFPRDKCCGDGIAPHVVDVLRSVGAGSVTAGWQPLRRLEIARGDLTAGAAMARPAWVIPRRVFDARLVERATAAGAVLRRHRVSTMRHGGARVRLDGSIAARVVIGADGAHSAVRRSLGELDGIRLGDGARAIALRGYAPTPPGRRGRQVIRFGDRRQPAYAWAFDRGDGLSNVGYGEAVDRADGATPLTKAVMLDQLDRLLPGAGALGTEWSGHHLPLSGWRCQMPDGPTLLVGDAAGLVNPLTGEGIYYAVATGVLAGRAAARALAGGAPAEAGRLHRATVRSLLGRHLHHTWLVSRLARRPRVLDAGLRAARGDRRAFDDLLEIGLGDGLVTARLAIRLTAGLAAGLATGAAPRLATDDATGLATDAATGLVPDAAARLVPGAATGFMPDVVTGLAGRTRHRRPAAVPRRGRP